MNAKLLLMIVSAQNCHVYQGWPSTLPETQETLAPVRQQRRLCPPQRYAWCLWLWRWSRAWDSDGSSGGCVETLNRRLYLASSRAMRSHWTHEAIILHTSSPLTPPSSTISACYKPPHQATTSCFSLHLLSLFIFCLLSSKLNIFGEKYHKKNNWIILYDLSFILSNPWKKHCFGDRN